MDQQTNVEECFYGSVTLGERGQIVIPAEARKELNIQPGDKLLVFRHPDNKRLLMLATVSEMQQMLDTMRRVLQVASDQLKKAPADEAASE